MAKIIDLKSKKVIHDEPIKADRLFLKKGESVFMPGYNILTLKSIYFDNIENPLYMFVKQNGEIITMRYDDIPNFRLPTSKRTLTFIIGTIERPEPLRNNMDEMIEIVKEGNLIEVVSVLKQLKEKSKTHRLNEYEESLRRVALETLVSEIMHNLSVEKEQAYKIINNGLGIKLEPELNND